MSILVEESDNGKSGSNINLPGGGFELGDIHVN